MTNLGNGLRSAERYEEAMSVQEARLSLMRRNGASEEDMLVVQSNLAGTYRMLNRDEDVLSTMRDVYHGYLKLFGEQNRQTLMVANNYAVSLGDLRRFKEAKSLLQKTMPVAQRVLGESDRIALQMRKIYAEVLCNDTDATLDDLRKAVTTFVELERTARRVLGNSHPNTALVGRNLLEARAELRRREASEQGDVNSTCAAVEAIALKE